MKRSMVALVLSGLVGMPSPLLWAQRDEPPSLSDGDRIRITLASFDKRWVGQLLSSDDKTLTLKVNERKQPVRVLRSDITKVEVGHRRTSGRGALRGLAVGTAVGLLGLGGLALACEGWGCLGPAFLSILAVPGGAVVGAISPGYRWKSLNTNDLHIALTPTRGGGVGAQVAFRF